MDLPENGHTATTNTYQMPGGGDDIVRVFYLTHVGSVPEFQELVTLMRTITDIRRAFTYNKVKAVATRGTADEIAFAEWLLNELDQPRNQTVAGENRPDPASLNYHLPFSANNEVRVLFLTHTPTVADFQKLVNEVRTTTRMRRVCTYNTLRAVALRGTSNEIALANQLIGERYK